MLLLQDLWTVGWYGLQVLAVVGLVSAIWWVFFPPTITGLLPGCLSIMPVFALIGCVVLLLEAFAVTIGLHAMNSDLSALSGFSREQIVKALYTAFVANVFAVFALPWAYMMLLDAVSAKRAPRLLKLLERHSADVGLDLESLARRAYLGQPCSAAVFGAKEMLRLAVLGAACIAAVRIIGPERLLGEPWMVLAWMALSSLLVIAEMYVARAGVLAVRRVAA